MDAGKFCQEHCNQIGVTWEECLVSLSKYLESTSGIYVDYSKSPNAILPDAFFFDPTETLEFLEYLEWEKEKKIDEIKKAETMSKLKNHERQTIILTDILAIGCIGGVMMMWRWIPELILPGAVFFILLAHLFYMISGE